MTYAKLMQDYLLAQENRLKIEEQNMKLIVALEKIKDIKYTHYGYDFATALGEAQDIARDILAEVRGKG